MEKLIVFEPVAEIGDEIFQEQWDDIEFAIVQDLFRQRFGEDL